MDYTPREMMAIMAAREIEDGSIVFCGTGISMLAAIAAKKITSPNCVIFFETGAVDSRLDEIPLVVSDPRVMYGASSTTGMLDAFAAMQNRIIGQYVVGILGAGQIDKFGNLNTTCIGPYDHPRIRFPGSGGGSDVTSFVPKSIIFMQQQKRKFVNKLDYLTSPGYLDGPGGREKAGLPPGGPSVVITNMGTFRFDDKSKEMYLQSTYPGIRTEQIVAEIEFEVDTSKVQEEKPPTEYELQILREKCDPHRLICN
ncbi:MAG: CoA-transferase [Desulfovermiculus sp.]|nr:CoA-transferase [Desulfovermiculus sp.]